MTPRTGIEPGTPRPKVRCATDKMGGVMIGDGRCVRRIEQVDISSRLFREKV